MPRDDMQNELKKCKNALDEKDRMLKKTLGELGRAKYVAPSSFRYPSIRHVDEHWLM